MGSDNQLTLGGHRLSVAMSEFAHDNLYMILLDTNLPPSIFDRGIIEPANKVSDIFCTYFCKSDRSYLDNTYRGSVDFLKIGSTSRILQNPQHASDATATLSWSMGASPCCPILSPGPGKDTPHR